MRTASFIACATLAVYCGSDDQAAAPRAGVDAATDADASNEPDVAIRRDASRDAPPRFDAPLFDAADAADAADGGVVVDDADTPCRDFATLADGVAFAPNAARLLATSRLGATVISPLDWSVQRTYAGHRGVILAAAISPDGRRGASVGDDDELRMWDAATGRTLARQPLSKPVLVEFADGGSSVVVLDSTGVHAFAWGEQRELWSKTSEAGAALPVLASASAGARLLVAAVGGGLDLLNASDGALVVHLDGRHGAFSPDGTKVAAAEGSTVRIYDAVEPTQNQTTITAPLSVRAVGLGPNAAWVAVSGGVSLEEITHVLSVPDGAILQTFKTSYGVDALSSSPDGRLLAAGAGELYVFDVVEGTVAYSNRRRGFIWNQSFSITDPFVAFARVGGDSEIWDLASGSRMQLIPRRTGGNQGTVAFHPDGSLLINHDDTASYWLPGGTAPVASFTYESGGMRPDDQGTLVFSPDGAGLAGPGPWTAPGNLRTWSARDGRLLREAPAHPDVIDALAWSPDGNFIATAGPDDSVADAGDDAGSDMRVVKVWTVADRRVLYTLMGHADLISSVAFSPDGTLLASADREGRVRLWSRADGALVRELASPPTQTGLTLDRFNGSVAFSPDGQFLASRAVHWIATGHSVYIAIFRVADGTIARELRGFGDGNLGDLGWSPDGRYLIGGAGPELRVWCMTPDAGGPTDAGGS